MPLVPRMIQELVFALPPLGEARVLDLLCKLILNPFQSILRTLIRWERGLQPGPGQSLSQVQTELSGQVSVQTGPGRSPWSSSNT